MALKQVDNGVVSWDPFKLYRDKWALITAGNIDKFNTMTISWGSFGELWGMPTATVYVRHSRYTYEFTENMDTFTLSFFNSGSRDKLSRLGTKSGRDIDKINNSGFTPFSTDGSVAFQEAELVVILKKIYKHDIIADEFIDKTVDNAIYGDNGDYHTAYVCKIEKVYLKG